MLSTSARGNECHNLDKPINSYYTLCFTDPELYVYDNVTASYLYGVLLHMNYSCMLCAGETYTIDSATWIIIYMKFCSHTVRAAWVDLEGSSYRRQELAYNDTT